MTEALETVRASIDAFNRRDLDALLELLDDDIEYDTREVLFTGPHRGKASVEELLGGLFEAVAEMWMHAERIEDLGDGRVLALVHQGGRGHGSGVTVEAHRGHVTTLRNGRIWRLRVYADPADALEAVGLAQAPSSGNR